MIKILKFILNVVRDSGKYLFIKLRYRFPNVLSIDDTLDLLLSERKSFSRFGDGEFGLIIGTSNGFQSYDLALANRLKEILNSDSRDCLVCIPGTLTTLDGMTIRARLMWMHLISKYYAGYNRYIQVNRTYPNSLVTRPYVDLLDKSRSLGFFRKLKLLWLDRNLLIIEGENSKLGVGNDLFANAKSIRRIVTINREAYSKYSEILQSTLEHCLKDDLILIALGPTATVLAYDLSNLGYQAADIGHVDIEYEWFLRKTKHKIPIIGKHVNELGSLGISEIQDKDYEKQVIIKV